MDATTPGQDGLQAAPNGKRIMGALGVTQILAWGMSFYLLTVLGEPISSDTGWPLTLVVAGFSAALLMSGLTSPLTGRLIARHGGRLVLAGGAVLMAAGLAAIGLAPVLPAFLAGWLVIGVAMSASLYDPAFSTLGRIYGVTARRPITTLTLYGGFASTVCWPLSAWLVDSVGWRGTCLTYAAIQLCVSLPLLLLGLPGESRQARQEGAEAAGATAALVLSRRDRAMFMLMATALMLVGMMMTILSVHLIALLQAREVGLAAAVSMGMLVGPAQVGGRIVEMAFGKRYHPIWTLVTASLLIAAGVLVLYLGFRVPAAALVLYGAGNGIWTIARGALPLALFGARDYPIVMGRLARPALVAQAVAPSVGALLIDVGGPDQTLALVAVLACLNVCVTLTLMRVSSPARSS